MVNADHRRLVFDQVGESAWRLCDTEIGEHHPGSVIAYVERTETGEYEAVWVGAGRRPATRHPSKQDVIAAAKRLLSIPSGPTRTKPVPIPSHPPTGWLP